ncbi:MAG: ATP-binding cassette domain-containing protein [Myxococcales bacterium]|nr:ATP-binding cassette domain-containing protein [Myxococcales bacterium]
MNPNVLRVLARLRGRFDDSLSGRSEDRPRLDVDLVFEGGVTAVVGPSGAGKTTLLEVIAGLVRPDDGEVKLGGEVLFDSRRRLYVPPHQRGVGLVFRDLALFPHLRVWENVAFGLTVSRKSERREQAHAWLARMRLTSLSDQLPCALSGGEAQRVALCRALAPGPRVLLLDEPFAALDRPLRLALCEELRPLLTDAARPVLLVSHDERDVESLASRVVHLRDGRVVNHLDHP